MDAISTDLSSSHEAGRKGEEKRQIGLTLQVPPVDQSSRVLMEGRSRKCCDS